jgi:hypothetical protein
MNLTIEAAISAATVDSQLLLWGVTETCYQLFEQSSLPCSGQYVGGLVALTSFFRSTQAFIINSANIGAVTYAAANSTGLPGGYSVCSSVISIFAIIPAVC